MNPRVCLFVLENTTTTQLTYKTDRKGLSRRIRFCASWAVDLKMCWSLMIEGPSSSASPADASYSSEVHHPRKPPGFHSYAPTPAAEGRFSGYRRDAFVLLAGGGNFTWYLRRCSGANVDKGGLLAAYLRACQFGHWSGIHFNVM